MKTPTPDHTYTYAPDGLRRSMHQGGSANPVSFVWDGDDLLNDYISGGVSVRYDVLDGEVLGHKGGANRYLYVPDPLGSVVNLLNTSQTIAGTYVYAPYGEVLSHTGASTPMQFVGALGYQTHIANRAYVRTRYYRPDLGRWQTRDPIAQSRESPNGYDYARHMPQSLTDPRGLFPYTRHCTEGTDAAIRLACSCPSRLGGDLVFINDRLFVEGCPEITADDLACLHDRCNSFCTVVTCLDTRWPWCICDRNCRECTVFGSDGTRNCGFVWERDIGSRCPHIYLCYPAHQTTGCYRRIDTPRFGSPTAQVMLHELLHVCLDFTYGGVLGRARRERCVTLAGALLTNRCGI